MFSGKVKVPYVVKESAKPAPLVYTQREMTNVAVVAENPSPAAPMVFTMSDVRVMKRSICWISMRGSRWALRSVGRTSRTTAETIACSAMTRLTVASGHCKANEVY